MTVKEFVLVAHTVRDVSVVTMDVVALAEHAPSLLNVTKLDSVTVPGTVLERNVETTAATEEKSVTSVVPNKLVDLTSFVLDHARQTVSTQTVHAGNVEMMAALDHAENVHKSLDKISDAETVCVPVDPSATSSSVDLTVAEATVEPVKEMPHVSTAFVSTPPLDVVEMVSVTQLTGKMFVLVTLIAEAAVSTTSVKNSLVKPNKTVLKIVSILF